MINLGRCLTYLLSHHEKVSLAGLGTFRQIGKPAYFDPEAQGYFPRTYAVMFRPDGAAHPADEIVGFDEGLVVDYIAAQRGVDASEAAEWFRKALAVHLNELEKTGETKLSGIGILRKKEEGIALKTIDSVMDPSQTVALELPILTPSPVNEEEAVRIDPPEPVGEMAEAVEEISELEEPKELQELHVPEPPLNLEPEIESNQRSGAPYWWMAAATILLLGAAFVVVRPTEVYTFLSARGVDLPILTRLAGDQPQPQQLEMSPAETAAVPLEDDSQMDDPTSLAGTDSLALDSVAGYGAMNETTPIESQEAAPKVSFEIIVGSFRSMAQAESFVNEMAEKGINVWAINSRMPENRKKVSCASYATEAEAYRALRDIQRRIEPGAWVARVER